MNLSYKINNILSNKCTRAIGNSKNARTSPYDGTESRDTTSSMQFYMCMYTFTLPVSVSITNTGAHIIISV